MKSVIITGASDGIGRAIAHAFARRKFKIGIISRRKDLLEEVGRECRELGATDVFIEAVDVTQHDFFRESLAKLDSQLGSTDIFIANAGMGASSELKKDQYSTVKKLIDLNVIAAIDGIEFFKSKMVEKREGTLVGVSSVAGARGLPGANIYCASKAALGVYLEALRIEIRKFNVKVIDVAPGFIDTAMTKTNDFYMPLLMDSEKAGEVFCRDILAGKPRSVAPRTFRAIRYLLKIIPGNIYDLIFSRLG